ncbi:hypothetical protein Syun_009946 [Stephania yunnanensis]|uniref:Pentatricopeptide repeat-containing protein n=1 Tax=Stephania yunnanensis TaxID=152371 RepID=A0AAP0KHY2_9MAGN
MMHHEDILGCVVTPNEATLVSLLSCCANLEGGGALIQGKQIHCYIIRNDVEVTVFLGTALISMYGRTGCLRNAVEVFDRMIAKEVCTWNAIICSLVSNGREKQALDMFQNMKREMMKPNEVTFVVLLTACARGKFVELGLRLFKSMSSEFAIVPKTEHYGCVVDLLGKAGLLEEASRFVDRMPFEPDASVLGALLGACKVHGDVELADNVGKKLLELQPQHCGRYIVLSNIYAEAGNWGSAAELRKVMLENGIDKIPAYSCIGSM